MLELVHRYDPRIAGNEVKKSGVERFKELVQNDIIRYEKIGQRLGHGGGRSHGRQDYETFEMPMHGGRDDGIGQYLVHVRVGTPGQKFWLIADTGSDLTWFNCRYDLGNGGGRRNGGLRPRTSFRSRKRVFVAGRSRSFQTVPCSSKLCHTELSALFSLTSCPNPSSPCEYDYRCVMVFISSIFIALNFVFIAIFLEFYVREKLTRFPMFIKINWLKIRFILLKFKSLAMS